LADLMRFQVDHLVITAFIGLAAVTHYRIASFMTTNFITLVATVVGVLMPLFSQLDGAKEYNQIKKAFFFGTKISICISSFVGYGLIAWGKPFIERWMGAEYLDAYPSLFVLISGCIFALWQSPSVGLLYGISKHRFFALFNSIEGVCNLLLSLLLVRYWGMLGVALGTFIPMAILKLFIQPVYVCRATSIPYREYMRHIIKTVGVVSVALILPLLISMRFSAPNYSTLFIIGGSSFCVYAGIVWLLGFNASEKYVIQTAFFSDKSSKN
jgi:O-antigen/teichoic acid export membrane protein